MAPPSLPLTLPYPIRLASMVFLPKLLLEYRNKPPLCEACQFGAAYCRPWRTKGNKIGSIRIPEQTNPEDVVSVHQIVSAQPVPIPQMSGFLTS